MKHCLATRRFCAPFRSPYLGDLGTSLTRARKISPWHDPLRRPFQSSFSKRARRCRTRSNSMVVLVLGEVGFDSFLPALGVKPEAAVLASAFLATASVVINFLGGLQLESKRAELQIELERDKLFQQQLREVQGVIARYRGPLLESAIDLEQRLWHLLTDQCFGWTTPDGLHEEVRYLLFTLAQFLGFVEVLRRESPRERPFLQAGNPQGSDVLSTVIEAMRFFLCSSPSYLEEWAAEGHTRPHPGLRRRRSREQVIEEHLRAQGYQERTFSNELRFDTGLMDTKSENMYPDGDRNAVLSADSMRSISSSSSSDDDLSGTDCGGGCHFGEGLETALLRISRGQQRAIGTLMISTPMGAERHYTLSYGEFHTRLESDTAFSRWFKDIEADVVDLATGPPWRGEGPFPVGRWTRVLLLQQLLVELFDILDPDCVRLPASRRERLMPVAWGPLPRLSLYQKRLQELSNASDFGGHQAALQGLRDLDKFRNIIASIDANADTSKEKSKKKTGRDSEASSWEGLTTQNENGPLAEIARAMQMVEGFRINNGFDVNDVNDSSSSSNGSDGSNKSKNRRPPAQGLTLAELEKEEARAAVRAAVRTAHLQARIDAGDQTKNKKDIQKE